MCLRRPSASASAAIGASACLLGRILGARRLLARCDGSWQREARGCVPTAAKPSRDKQASTFAAVRSHQRGSSCRTGNPRCSAHCLALAIAMRIAWPLSMPLASRAVAISRALTRAGALRRRIAGGSASSRQGIGGKAAFAANTLDGKRSHFAPSRSGNPTPRPLVQMRLASSTWPCAAAASA